MPIKNKLGRTKKHYFATRLLPLWRFDLKSRPTELVIDKKISCFVLSSEIKKNTLSTTCYRRTVKSRDIRPRGLLKLACFKDH